MIRKVQLEDAEAIQKIYNYYILNTIITFETEPITVDEMRQRIVEISSKYDWIVFENEQKKICGYAYLTTFRTRAAYQHSVESSVYLDVTETGKGIGSLLYKELFSRIDKEKYHAVLGCIALPNDESVKLHEKFGFTKAAHLKEVGYKFGKWVDVGYWQLLIGVENEK